MLTTSPFSCTVALIAFVLTFSLCTALLHAETPPSLASDWFLVDGKSAPSDSGASSVPSPTEAPTPPPYVFGGPFQERLKLTGDWFGLRDKLAFYGITLDVSLTQFFQGVASGGKEQAFEYGGKGDYYLNIDGHKLGLWRGFSVTMHTETRYGNSVNDIDGMFSFGNLNLAVPQLNGTVTAITSLKLTQAVTENFLIFGGKINALDEFNLNFTGTNGIDRFMNSAMVSNMITARTIPYSTYGLGFGIVSKDVMLFNFMVRDPDDHSTTWDTPFEHGVLLTALGRLPVEPMGLPGHEVIGVSWSSRKYTELERGSLIVVPGQGIVAPQKSGSWAVYYNFDQYLWVNPRNPNVGLGVFGMTGISDGNPNPIRWNVTVGVGGNNPIALREADTFGVGYFHLGVSSDLKNLLSGPAAVGRQLAQRDEQGVELFYNITLTPWCHLTADLQIVQPSTKSLETTVLPGMRLKIDF